MSSTTEAQWRESFYEAERCYEELKALAELPLEQSADAGPALEQWMELMKVMDVRNLNSDPAFTEPFLERLQLMNEELRRLFIKRRDAMGEAFKQQKKKHAGIDAYRRT